MERIIDADSHFMEPLDLWQQHAAPKFRTRCLRFERYPKDAVTVEDIRATESGGLSTEELLGVAVGYGQKEAGKALKSFDPAAAFSYSLGDMDKRLVILTLIQSGRQPRS